MIIKNVKEVMMEVEKFLKAGRFSFSILNWDMRNNAVINELIVKYNERTRKPMLYIKNPDGSIVPIVTESDEKLKDFVGSFIEISVDRTKNYEPSMWFMLRKDGSGNTGWNKDTIKQFHQYIEQNYNQLKPYALQVFKEGKRELLVPYMDASMVFYDLGKLIADESIHGFDEVAKLLYSLVTQIRDNLVELMNTIQDKFDDMDAKLRHENKRQNQEIEGLKSQMDATDKKLNDLLDRLGDVKSTTERRLLPTTISVAGEANMIYPVRIRYTNGGFSIAGGQEFFMGSMFLNMENEYRNIVVQIGNDHITTSSGYYIGKQDEFFCYTHKVIDGSNAKHYVYNVSQVAAGDFILMLRGRTTYTLWCKYPDGIEITNTASTINIGSGSYAPISESVKTQNPLLTDDTILSADTCRTFSGSIHVVDSIIVGTNTKMRIGG